jgi:hypothetical protein
LLSLSRTYSDFYQTLISLTISILHKNPSAEPVVIPHQLLATIPPEDGKHDDDDIAVDNRKPAAKTQEEMVTTAVQEHMLNNTNLNSLAIGGQVLPWICEFCDSQWPPSQKRCGACKRWKGGKRSLSNKRDNKEITVPNNKGNKRERKRKLLTPIPGQEGVDIPLVVGGAFIVGEATFSPLTGGVNANNSSLGPSIGISS